MLVAIFFQHQIFFEYPGGQNKDKIFTFQQIQTKSVGHWIWKGLICLIRTSYYSLRKENLHSKRHFTYKRASQEKYEY